MPRTNFITLEGGDGSGKTSVLDFLFQSLHNQGCDVIKTREPGGTTFGDQVRKLLLNHSEGYHIGGRSELLLYLASRAQHVDELILPALNAEKIVLCDRFNDSTIAYQGAGRGFGISEVEKLCQFASLSVKPKLTLLLDIDPIEGLKRVRKARKDESAPGQFDRIESEALQFHQTVRRCYLELAKREPERIKYIDASRPVESVCEECLEYVKQLPVFRT